MLFDSTDLSIPPDFPLLEWDIYPYCVESDNEAIFWLVLPDTLVGCGLCREPCSRSLQGLFHHLRVCRHRRKFEELRSCVGPYGDMPVRSDGTFVDPLDVFQEIGAARRKNSTVARAYTDYCGRRKKREVSCSCMSTSCKKEPYMSDKIFVKKEVCITPGSLNCFSSPTGCNIVIRLQIPSIPDDFPLLNWGNYPYRVESDKKASCFWLVLPDTLVGCGLCREPVSRSLQGLVHHLRICPHRRFYEKLRSRIGISGSMPVSDDGHFLEPVDATQEINLVGRKNAVVARVHTECDMNE